MVSEVVKGKTRRILKDANSSGSDIDQQDVVIEGDLEVYSKEVLQALIKDGIPPTPNNFTLYFDRLLDDKSQNSKKAILSVLEQEESNEDERALSLEQNLKQGFASIKNILTLSANLYKNISLMSKILEKRKQEFQESAKDPQTIKIADSLEEDIEKLNVILKNQNSSMKELYDDTVKVIKNVENETVFDNQFGVYNKRYLMTKIAHEIELIGKFKYKSSLIMIELSRELKGGVKNEKALMLMTKTIARLLLKTSRRSDIVAHYGNGVFVMLLKHTDIESAKKASERLCDLVSNSTFFLADREMQLKISIGITDVTAVSSAEEVIVSSMEGIERAYENPNSDYAVVLRK